MNLPPFARIQGEGQTEAASGGPEAMSGTCFAALGERLRQNGYEPLPIVKGQKRPAPTRWSKVEVNEHQVAEWCQQYPGHGIGLRTGHLVGLDIDILDPDRAHEVMQRAQVRLGETLLRVGLWPKKMLLYRTETPFARLKVGQVEVLGAGQQFVAFGIHPGTGAPYHWPQGETPADVALSDLPQVTAEQIHGFLAELGPETRPGAARSRGSASGCSSDGFGDGEIVRDARGIVTDGRDAWLSRIAFHAVHNALQSNRAVDAGHLTSAVWDRFLETTDIGRERTSRARPYIPADAARKVADKLRLHRRGDLPARLLPDVAPSYAPPHLGVEDGRQALETTITGFCGSVFDWHDAESVQAPPKLAIKATVGLGKSSIARRQLLALRQRLVTAGRPARILILTPSHALAEETADAWREAGENVAVLRGFERSHPQMRQPMCRNLPAVRAAVAQRTDIFKSACEASGGKRCRFHAGCLKLENRKEVASANIVVAPYDVMFQDFEGGSKNVGLVVIDEACWVRATTDVAGLTLDGLSDTAMASIKHRKRKDKITAQAADLQVFRSGARTALERSGTRPLATADLRAAGLTASDCRAAVDLERARLAPSELEPGLSQSRAEKAFKKAQGNEAIYAWVDFWEAMTDLAGGLVEGRIRLIAPDTSSGVARISVVGMKQMSPTLAALPLLHLDATLRPQIAASILPGLTVKTIVVAAPNMNVALVTGRFGKQRLMDGLGEDGAVADGSLLGQCRDYVRWHAMGMDEGDVLIVTHKALEPVFADIPGVVTGHFNAIAGIDIWKNIRKLIIIGRPLPPDKELPGVVAALFGQSACGGYQTVPVGLLMRDGRSQTVRAQHHSNEKCEELRAAICDDEMIQVTGRGRGVNRTADDPLEVHILADVALPLVYDRVMPWEAVQPDILQRMLLDGIAVDSPQDAWALHPRLFKNAEQAKKALQGAPFKGKSPYIIERPFSLKSAQYRHGGRGRGLQIAWWVEADNEAARRQLEVVLGPLAGWEPF